MTHRLRNVQLSVDNGGWGGECTCGRWATVMCDTARRVRQEFKEHLRMVKENERK